ncbi:hypothetical protein DXG01_002817 [Tephrocybe rancida]|nr:hypothetical protein DXG01_002817 [Tephrocybe rancida]
MGSVEGPLRTRSLPRPQSPIPRIKQFLSLGSPISQHLPEAYRYARIPTEVIKTFALEAFVNCPKLTCNIRMLVVRPNNVERAPAGDHLDEDFVAGLIATVASRMSLLRSFYWDGLEMPNDKLWLALRQLFVGSSTSLFKMAA